MTVRKLGREEGSELPLRSGIRRSSKLKGELIVTCPVGTRDAFCRGEVGALVRKNFVLEKSGLESL